MSDLDKLHAVARAAKALVETARDLDFHRSTVDEDALVLLESALEAAGFGMTDSEFEAMLLAEEARRFTELRDGFNDEEGY